MTNEVDLALNSAQHPLPFCRALDQDLLRARLTQADLAKKAQVSQQSVSKWRVKNHLPFQQRERLAILLKEIIGEKSYIYQYFKNGHLERVMGPEMLDKRANLNYPDWAHQTKGQHLSRTKTSSKNSSKLETYITKDEKRKFPNTPSFNKHNSWLSEITRQFNGVKTHHLYQDKRGVKAVFDVAIPKLRTLITCVGTFVNHRPVRDLLTYSPQLVKLCAMYLNSVRDLKSSKHSNPINFVVLNGICGRDEPTENELAITEWLGYIGISMLHVRSYQEGFVALSHLYHQAPNAD